MPANPLTQSGEPVTWNFKLLAQNDLGGFGGMGEGMSVQIAKDGRRIMWLAHESAPKNFTGVDVSDPRNPKVVVQTDLPKPHMRSNSLETASDIMAVAYQTQKTGQQPAGLRTVRHLGAGEAALDLVFRLLGTDIARRASVMVLRRRICAHGLRLARLQAEQPERRPVLPLHRRARSVEAERNRPLVDAGHERDRQCRTAAASPARQRLSRAQHQRLSAAPGPALPLLHRRRHVRDGHQGQGQSEGHLALDQFTALYRLHAHGGAAVRSQPHAGDRRIRPKTPARTGRN